MKFYKSDTRQSYDLTITRRTDPAGNDKVFEWHLNLDATGLAALIRSVDTATNEGKMASAIGLKRKRK